MIFDLLAPPPGPRGRGQKKMWRCTPHSCDKLTHQIWLDFVQWFRRRERDGRMDRRTDGGDCNIPDAFLKKRGDNYKLLHAYVQCVYIVSAKYQIAPTKAVVGVDRHYPCIYKPYKGTIV